ncbi:Ankyrin repeat protein 2 [Giardia muris]|uniref:Ankyrin repeat protein 2 n=1 Tax=Giardia muris TaxID=5742 RepID=A0A4Z1TD52_GIAMU|nr:Ankyrin repeat protein 2 [Giardia muris]|eukprot:TNJ30451.1 Ankyrin repeat protein 2 [Giardia muris]
MTTTNQSSETDSKLLRQAIIEGDVEMTRRRIGDLTAQNCKSLLLEALETHISPIIVLICKGLYHKRIAVELSPLPIPSDYRLLDSTGYTRLMKAASEGKLSNVEANLHELRLQLPDGTTALMLAARHGHVDCLKLLLAEVMIRTTEGISAYDAAVEGASLNAGSKSCQECARILSEYLPNLFSTSPNTLRKRIRELERTVVQRNRELDIAQRKVDILEQQLNDLMATKGSSMTDCETKIQALYAELRKKGTENDSMSMLINKLQADIIDRDDTIQELRNRVIKADKLIASLNPRGLVTASEGKTAISFTFKKPEDKPHITDEMITSQEKDLLQNHDLEQKRRNTPTVEEDIHKLYDGSSEIVLRLSGNSGDSKQPGRRSTSTSNKSPSYSSVAPLEDFSRVMDKSKIAISNILAANKAHENEIGIGDNRGRSVKKNKQKDYQSAEKQEGKLTCADLNVITDDPPTRRPSSTSRQISRWDDHRTSPTEPSGGRPLSSRMCRASKANKPGRCFKCRMNYADGTINPCGHYAICHGCALILKGKHCPDCKALFTGYIQRFQ